MRKVSYKCQLLLVFPWEYFWTNFEGNTFPWTDIVDFEKPVKASWLIDSWFSWLVLAYVRITETVCKMSLQFVVRTMHTWLVVNNVTLALYIILLMSGSAWWRAYMYLGGHWASTTLAGKICWLCWCLITIRGQKEQEQWWVEVILVIPNENTKMVAMSFF